MRRTPREEGARWLEQAIEDLRWAKDLAERGGYHIACFLAQQIGEKALKGFLYAQGEDLVTGHSVERLCRQAARYDPAFDQLVARWSILDGYYIPTRYPNSVPDSIPARIFTRDAAAEAVRLADEMVTHVTDRLSRTEGGGSGG